MHAGSRKPWLDADGQVHLPLMFMYPETMQVSTLCRCSFRLMRCRTCPGNYHTSSCDMQEVIPALHGHVALARGTRACGTQATTPSGLIVDSWDSQHASQLRCQLKL